MSRQRLLVLVLASVLVLAGLAYWIVPKLESYEVDVVEDISEKVRRNPFLAMERFLAKLGQRAETTRSTEVLVNPPDVRDTIFVEYTDELFTRDRTQRMLAWLERGGHLVLELSSYRWEDDQVPDNALLDRLPIRLYEGDEPTERQCGTAPTSRLVRTGRQTFLLQSDLGEAWLEDESGQAETWKMEGVPVLLRYRVGEGTLTLIPGRYLWKNDRIGTHDHAAYLMALLGKPHGTVWVLYQPVVDNLLQIIWRHAAETVIALALTVTLLLWGLYNRFGPMIVTETRRRRRLGEHVQAMALFAWRHGRAANLLSAARQELRHRAELRHPGFQYRTPTEQFAWLAERAEVSPEAVRHALESESDRPGSLVASVTLLQKLRNSL